MKKALVLNNKVIQISETNFDVAEPLQWVDCDEQVSVGWFYENNIFVAPDEVVIIPSPVTMRQARLALLSIGKLSDVETVIDSLDEPDRSAARIEWDFSNEVHRDKAFVMQLGPALGLSDTDLDNLFIEASKL